MSKGALWGARASAELTVFGRHLDDLIDYLMTNPRFAQYVNIGKAKVIGTELEASAEWERWALYLAATWMDPVNETPGYMDGDPLANRPEWESFPVLRILSCNSALFHIVTVDFFPSFYLKSGIFQGFLRL